MKRASERRLNGEAAEEFIKKWLRAQPSGVDEYDLETRNLCIEVKSCEAFHKSGRPSSYQCGRFSIDKTNHAALRRAAADRNKEPVYIFVVRIERRYIWKLVKWQEVKLPPKKIACHLSWRSIWQS